MRASGRFTASILVALTGIGSGLAPAGTEQPKSGRAGDATGFGMSPAVACTRVDGLEKYTPLPGASLTAEDKLKVYFRPLHFKVEPVKGQYRARFTEDGRVRRKGEKAVLSREDKLLEYETRFDSPDYQIYLVNNIGLKNLPPGDYEFDIILHDALDEGSTATQTLPFTVIPTPKVAPDSKIDGPDNPEGPPGSAEESKAKKSGKAKKLRPPR